MIVNDYLLSIRCALIYSILINNEPNIFQWKMENEKWNLRLRGYNVKLEEDTITTKLVYSQCFYP